MKATYDDKVFGGTPLEEALPVNLGGGNPEFTYEPRCRVCKKGRDFVGTINTLVLSGLAYTEILRMIEPQNEKYREIGEGISYQSLYNHVHNHMPPKSWIVRKSLEKRALQASQSLEKMVDSLVTDSSYAETMMQIGFQNMVENPKTVSARDGLDAAKTLHEFEKEAKEDSSMVEVMAQLSQIIQAVREVVTEDQMKQILAKLDNASDFGPDDEPEELEIIED